jgi:ankyrin repeat protein
MNNRHSFINKLCHSPIRRRAAVLLVLLVWSSRAFGGEIHDAAKRGDLEKVKALLKANPNWVSRKDPDGMTPLHKAAGAGVKDVVELLLAKGAEVNAKDWRAVLEPVVARYQGRNPSLILSLLITGSYSIGLLLLL